MGRLHVNFLSIQCCSCRATTKDIYQSKRSFDLRRSKNMHQPSQRTRLPAFQEEYTRSSPLLQNIVFITGFEFSRKLPLLSFNDLIMILIKASPAYVAFHLILPCSTRAEIANLWLLTLTMICAHSSSPFLTDPFDLDSSTLR